jgi:hypothetical protein
LCLWGLSVRLCVCLDLPHCPTWLDADEESKPEEMDADATAEVGASNEGGDAVVLLRFCRSSILSKHVTSSSSRTRTIPKRIRASGMMMTSRTWTRTKDMGRCYSSRQSSRHSECAVHFDLESTRAREVRHATAERTVESTAESTAETAGGDWGGRTRPASGLGSR